MLRQNGLVKISLHVSNIDQIAGQARNCYCVFIFCCYEL